MQDATITFDQTVTDADGNNGRQINHTPVCVSADGESVVFELPNGVSWGCDHADLADVVFLGELGSR